MKKNVSRIIFKYGNINNIPKPYRDKSDVLIDMVKLDDNCIEVKCFFDDSNLSKEEALDYSQKISETIALKTSLKYGLSSKCELNINSLWEEKETKSHTVDTVVMNTVNIETAGSFDVDVKKISEPIELRYAMECFNRALEYKESDFYDEKSIAFWLSLSWESLQLYLDVKDENELKKDIKNKKIIPSKKLKDFKYTIGRHYRHVKGEFTGNSISIEGCIKCMQIILLYYIEHKLNKNGAG